MSQPIRSPGSVMPPGWPHLSQQNNNSNFFSPASLTAAAADLPPPSRPRLRRVESSSSEDSVLLSIAKARSPTKQSLAQFSPPQAPTPSFTTSHSNSSQASLQNFSRPTPSPLSSAAKLAARSVASSHDLRQRNASPLGLTPNRPGGHARKHSQTAGAFESILPSISTSSLFTQKPMSSQQLPVQLELSASHIAAQAAVLSHQQSQQLSQQMLQQQSRQRSQTLPKPSENQAEINAPQKRTSGPLSPPVLSLTEASAPRETGFGTQGHHNGQRGSTVAAMAANFAFPRSGQTSPTSRIPPQAQAPPPLPPPLPEKKPEKSSKVNLFKRPGKIGTKAEAKEKPLPSPSKIGSALSALQRGNFSTTSLDVLAAPPFYNANNSSTATLRPLDSQYVEKEGREKKHYFLSRQRHKAKDKDDYHSQLSSAASNSRPTDPSAPSSLYSFNLPSSPGPNSSTFKNISSLGHGGRTRKRDERADFNDSGGSINDWAGSGSLENRGALPLEPIDSAKYGLNSMSMDDAFPYLRAKLLVVFEREALRLPIEDFNRIVTLHLQYCIKQNSPKQVLDDLCDLLWTGFTSIDQQLRKHPEDRLIPDLVDIWIHVFTSVLPFMQAVFLPLDQEFAGCGSLMTADQARDFWGGVIASQLDNNSTGNAVNVAPASAVLDVRRLVLTSYRDVIILPRYDKLRTIFSRLSLEFLPGALVSPLPDVATFSTSPRAESAPSFSFVQRPGTATSLEPSTVSYNSTSTTLLGDLSGDGRRRLRSFDWFFSSAVHHQQQQQQQQQQQTLYYPREQNAEDVADMVGRMLQCMSVLAGASGRGSGDERAKRVEELGRLLKLNWLGRGRTGRNRRGIVGGRVARGDDTAREDVMHG